MQVTFWGMFAIGSNSRPVQRTVQNYVALFKSDHVCSVQSIKSHQNRNLNGIAYLPQVH